MKKMRTKVEPWMDAIEMKIKKLKTTKIRMKEQWIKTFEMKVL